MPPFSDSPISLHSAFRQKLWGEGILLRPVIGQQRAPLRRCDDEHHPDRRSPSVPFHTFPVHGLRGLELGELERPAEPKTLQICGLYFFRAFAEDRVETKVGYIGNNLEVMGLAACASAATAAQGVYAVLPFEVGLSYFPLTAPSLNVRIRGPRDTYLKAVTQRSLDPGGGPTEITRNATGFRFVPHGDKLLLFGEAGYRRPASADVHEIWFRTGTMHNSTAYINLATNKVESGNHAAFVLMDSQLRQHDQLHPDHELYLGGTAMVADHRFNPYDSYYELRLYQKGPFRTRPLDMASMVDYYSGHSGNLTKSMAASGHTVWRASASLTGSYALRVHPGQYMNFGLSYVRGAAVTPRLHDALVASASYTVFF